MAKKSLATRVLEVLPKDGGSLGLSEIAKGAGRGVTERAVSHAVYGLKRRQLLKHGERGSWALSKKGLAAVNEVTSKLGKGKNAEAD